jgi:hypothetical protein
MTLLGDVVPYYGCKSKVRSDAAVCLFNLETPIIGTKAIPVRKAGPHLLSPTLVLPLLNSNSTVVANLANNHMMDYGDDGLRSTSTECSRKNVLVVGAGENSEKARMPEAINVGGKTIGIIGCCEKQFGVATSWKSGVASVGGWIYSAIRDLRNRTDIVIISIHGGSEMSPWPSPEWQELLRSFVDAGADIIHGHHSHVPQGYEEYNKGLIFYGLGSFGANPNCWKDQPNVLWSLMPEIKFDNQKWKYEINTSVVSHDDDSPLLVRKSTSKELTEHKEYLERINKPLHDKRLLAGLWQELSVRMYDKSYAAYLGFPDGHHESGKLWFKKCAKYALTGMKEYVGSRRNVLRRSTHEELSLWYHLFSCETHQGSIAVALGVLSGELADFRTDETRSLVDEMIPSSCDRQ